MNWRASTWMWPYLAGLNVISFLGAYGGGINYIKFGWDFLCLALLCALSLYLAIIMRADDTHVKDTLFHLEEETRTGIPSSIPDAKRE